MHRTVKALAALAGAATVGLAAPAAAFASEGEIEIHPRVVEQGDWIHLSTEACSSQATVWVTIDGVRHRITLMTKTSEGITGRFRVPRDADSGTYEVEGTCMTTGKVLEGHFRVSHEPEGGAPTGAGGSVTGMNMAETAGGGMLAALAAAGGVAVLRRRRVSGRA